MADGFAAAPRERGHGVSDSRPAHGTISDPPSRRSGCALVEMVGHAEGVGDAAVEPVVLTLDESQRLPLVRVRGNVQVPPEVSLAT